MSVPMPSRRRPRLRKLVREPWTAAARRSPALRLYCGRRGYLTPNFRVSEMADTETRKLPMRLRSSARRHCLNLERLKHELAERAGRPVAVVIDGPYRTGPHNRRIGGAKFSQHVKACASDHFAAQVRRWQDATGMTRTQVVALCERLFRGVGNEQSNTLHLDSRTGPIARFVIWVGAR